MTRMREPKDRTWALARDPKESLRATVAEVRRSQQKGTRAATGKYKWETDEAALRSGSRAGPKRKCGIVTKTGSKWRFVPDTLEPATREHQVELRRVVQCARDAADAAGFLPEESAPLEVICRRSSTRGESWGPRKARRKGIRATAGAAVARENAELFAAVCRPPRTVKHVQDPDNETKYHTVKLSSAELEVQARHKKWLWKRLTKKLFKNYPKGLSRGLRGIKR